MPWHTCNGRRPRGKKSKRARAGRFLYNSLYMPMNIKNFFPYIWQNRARRIFFICIASAALVIVAGSAVLRAIFTGLPSIDHLDEYTPAVSSRVFDINNQVIAEFSVERRALLPLNKIPVDIQNAVISMEDDKFFQHWGVSPRGIMRAMFRDLRHKRAAQGGSTITQQLSKNIFLKPEKTILRKVREMILAVQIEQNFSKQEILQMYLNQIYFGEGAYGVQAAAKRYFAKDVDKLTLGECALLAGLIPSPGSYSPFANPEKARQRRTLVLQSMLKEGHITKEEMIAAEQEKLPEDKPFALGAQAPYFVEYVRQYLEPKYGIDMLWKGGLKIYTTLDLNSQLAAEKVMDARFKGLDDEVAKQLAADKKGVADVSTSSAPLKLQGAFLAMDVKTGAIRVMIGGRDFKETKFNRATQAMRQPGSTFKPFVWMTALMNGYTPATLVSDMPVAYYFDGKDWRLLDGATNQEAIDLATQPFIGNPDFKIWEPENFDKKSMGFITLRRGLELSRNLVSVHLIDKLGPTQVAETAKMAGIKKKLQPVLSLGLGTSAVPLIEMTNAFATFFNNGIMVEPFAVMRVEDSTGKVLEQNEPVETEVFTPQNAFLMTNMMRGVVERGTGGRARALKRPIAGKTGTSQDHRDMWFIGGTPDIVAGAWMGYDDFSTIESTDWTGGGTVVPWWTEIMQEVLKDQPVRDFPVPEGITFVIVDPESGKLALPTCKKRFMEAFRKGTEPKTFCDLYH